MKLSNILFALLVMVLGVSCYDNKGSDSYAGKLGIRVEGIEKSMHVNVADVLTLSPDIWPEDREYRCFWGIADKENQWSTIDTLSHEKDLEMKVTQKTGTYLLRFYAEDVATGIFSYTEYELFVETDMASGWWILKSVDETADIDFFSKEKKKENVIAGVNGRSLAGKAVDMSFTMNYWLYDEEKESSVKANTVFAASENDLVALDYYSAKIVNDYDHLFFEAPKRKKIDYLFRGASDTHVVVDGELYTMPNMKSDPYRQFVIKHTGDFELSRWRVASGWGLPLMYDNKSASFCAIDRFSLDLNYLGENGEFGNHRNTGMDLLFMGAKSSGNAGDEAYAILKVKDKEEYKLAHLNGAPRPGKSPLKEKMKELSGDLKLLKAEYKTLNQMNNIIYFFEGGQLYAYNIDGGTEAKENIVLKAGEEVTYMDYVKYAAYGDNDNWFEYLVIATAKDGNYTVGLHPVQAGHVLPAEKTMQGKGRVARTIAMFQGKWGINTSTYF